MSEASDILHMQLFQNGTRIHVIPCKSHIITVPIVIAFVELKKYAITKSVRLWKIIKLLSIGVNVLLLI